MGLLDEIITENDKIKNSKSNIMKLYQSDNRPWVIGYSGGKDSTTVLQLVVESLLAMKEDGVDLSKKVYVISSDTMVETPLIISSINNNLKKVQEYADISNLPIQTQLVRPSIDQTFWVNLIGKGYPVPNQSFRWCTDRMKIDPSNRFIKEKVSEHGEVIVLLGVRENESIARGQNIKRHSIEGKLIMRHSSLANAFTFAPIKDFTVDDVWEYLLSNESPWSVNNQELFKLYADSNANECPLIIDQATKESAGSCGNSRFGCWVCTVVNEDKALTGFVENGVEWLRPLLKFRNWLSMHRDDRVARMKIRANGSIYTVALKQIDYDDCVKVIIPKKGNRDRIEITIKNDVARGSNGIIYDIVDRNKLDIYLKENNIDLTKGLITEFLIREGNQYYLLGLGPYTFEFRKKILEKLLLIQCTLNNQGHDVELITEKELKQIRREWLNRNYYDDDIPNIYKKIYGIDLSWEKNDISLISQRQLKKIRRLCSEENLYFEPLARMIKFEHENSFLKKKVGATKKISEILTKDYLNI